MNVRAKHGGGIVVPPEVTDECRRIAQLLRNGKLDKLAALFERAYPYTLEHTTFPLFDGTTYVITGDIPLMWQRDSSAQVNHYIPLLTRSAALTVLVEGLIRRQTLFVLADPYGTSFRLYLDFDHVGKKVLTDWDVRSGRTIHVAMHNWELDNLAYVLRLAHRFYRATRRVEVFDDVWRASVDLILATVECEQQHAACSKYIYPELPYGGHGSKVCEGHGLVWSAFRPSDDATKYGYLVPSNMMMAVSLRQAAEVLREGLGDEVRAARCERVAARIDEGIARHAVVAAGSERIYAFEVDACGSSVLVDDANVPSLLSIEYLGYTNAAADPNGDVARATRGYILSSKNPYYFKGRYAGIGSPHTPLKMIWHIALIAEALSARDGNDLQRLLQTIEETATHGVVHESFHVDNAAKFTRPSFAWANSLLAELVVERLDRILATHVCRTQPKLHVCVTK